MKEFIWKEVSILTLRYETDSTSSIKNVQYQTHNATLYDYSVRKQNFHDESSWSISYIRMKCEIKSGVSNSKII